MVDLSETKELLENLRADLTISKGVRDMLQEIGDELVDEQHIDIKMKLDAALQKLEDISLDPNLSADVRTRLWNLTSLLEFAQSSK